ncbi:MAG: DUF1570 domain-containing protein [Planctomycetes bacterium]|nr:DUF1570 domain-containing protein [Planctomycetota bacterium]
MRRLLPAALLAFLMVTFASPAQGGYLIIRILLEGTGEAGGAPVPGGEARPPMGGFPQPPMGGFPQPPMGGFPQPPKGGFPQPMGGIQPPMGVNGPGASHDPTRSMVVVVPVEEDLLHVAPFYAGKPKDQFRNPLWQAKLHATLHKEKIVTNLFTDSSSIQWYTTLKETPGPGAKRTHAIDVRERHGKWAKTMTDLKVGYNLIVEALGYGLVDESVKYADELFTVAEQKKDALPPEVANFVKAYGPIKEKLQAQAAKRSLSEFWQGKLEAATVNTSAHYAILSWDATEDEIDRRRTLLEQNFKAFFLLHALRGIELKLPEAPLVVVLAKQGSIVRQYAHALDASGRMASDGFYSPEHDVLVLSPERLDPLGQTFTAQLRDTYRDGIPRKQLLAGGGPDLDTNGEKGKKPDDVARLQTIALVERFIDEQATICTISREGTLQLMYATGQIPRFVSLPEWVTNGAGNFFTRPKDPAFIKHSDGKWWMTVSPSPGYGVPNYVLQRQFRELYGPLLEEKKDKKDIPEQRTQRVTLLKNVLADAYFLGLRDQKEPNDPDPVKLDKSGVALSSGTTPNINPGGQPPVGVTGPGGQPPMGGPGVGMGDPNAPREDVIGIRRKKWEVLNTKSQATSWALYYYLAKARPDELRKFLAELAAMPRDLPLDSPTITAAFCRSFGIAGTPESFSKFADDWMDYIHTVPPLGIDIPLVDPKPHTSGTDPKVDPKGMNPMGMGK